MSDTITLIGLVATSPRHIVTSEGLAITSFRLASNQRRYDRKKAAWVDGDTNWYTVTCFRELALNVAESIKKGERILVTGKLKIRDWESGERSGTTVEVEAETLGHNLIWGVSRFERVQHNADSKNGADTEFVPPSDVESSAAKEQLAWAG